MSSSLRWIASLLLLLIMSTPLWADGCIGGAFRRRDRSELTPEIKADPEHDLVILQDPNIKQAELRIPRRLMLAEAPSGVSTRHAMAGLALSVGFVGCGLWCLRFRGKQVPRTKLIVAGGMVVLLLGGLTVGNFANAKMQPFQLPPPPVVTLADGTPITVQIVEGGDEVQLMLPPDLADKIMKR